MRISDWSADVCSSDLAHLGIVGQQDAEPGDTATRDFVLQRRAHRLADRGSRIVKRGAPVRGGDADVDGDTTGGATGARDRKTVVSGKSVSGRVDLGGRRIL